VASRRRRRASAGSGYGDSSCTVLVG
jgi:hypothetical protein